MAATVALAVVVLGLSASSAASLSEQAPAGPGVHAAAVPTEIINDAVGDVADPHGDIVQAGAGTDASGYAFSVHVKTPIDPRTDLSWRIRPTHIQWFLDTNLDSEADAVAVMQADGAGNLHAVMERFSDQFVYCTGQGRYTAAHDYLATFPAGCIPGLRHFRWSVIMTYDPGSAPTDDVAPDGSFAPVITVGQVGYWMLGTDGVVYAFGSAFGVRRIAFGAAAMTPRLDGSGFWIVDAAGHVFVRGSAARFGAAPPLSLGERITTISATPTGSGYWLFSDRGRVFPYGSARSYGDLAALHLNGSIVASVATPTGLGYYMIGADGGVFAFGDAQFRGSMGGQHLNRPVVGIAPSPDNAGYWLVASDGGVFAFSAPFRGSMGNTVLNQPVQGLVPYGNGYLMVAADGGVFDFSNRAFLGSLAGVQLSAPIVGIAAFTT
ncbi:MAG: Esterase [Actinomycetia bacterium]|nr:Esterase [Actinomycetes bacterium]